MRLPIKVRIFNENGQLVQSYNRTIKTRIIADVQVGLTAKDAFEGTCRVTYNPKEDYWNEFNFRTYSEFIHNLNQITEKDLVKEFI
jgi:hypothetical protein